MKFAVRKPNPKKSFKARTTGKVEVGGSNPLGSFLVFSGMETGLLVVSGKGSDPMSENHPLDRNNQ